MNEEIYEKLVSVDNEPPIIIAEMSGNHQNSLDAAKAFVTKIAENPPSIIKFQVYKPETITLESTRNDFFVDSSSSWSDHKTLFDLYKKAHTPWEWIKVLADLCEKKDLPWFASPFDETAVDFLENIGCRAYKLASPEITDIGLIEKIAQTEKPIVVSTGVADLDDLDLAVKTIKKYHNFFSILKCTSAYPTPLSELNLRAIPMLKKRYNCKVGFSDHSLGEIASIVAVSLGAQIIEKHFKMDGDDESVDHHFSMEISKLKVFTENLKSANFCCGQPSLAFGESVTSGLSGRRSLYVSKQINIGEKFTKENVKSVRPSFGLHPKYLPKVIGKTATRVLNIGDRITNDAILGFKE